MTTAPLTLPDHDAHHFRLALAAAKERLGISGNAIDKLCYFSEGKTSAVLRNHTRVYLRDVARYCEKLDISPEKPWGIEVCPSCAQAIPRNGHDIVGEEDAVSEDDMMIRELLASFEGTLRLHLMSEKKTPLQALRHLWWQVEDADLCQFLRELPDSEREMILDELIAIEKNGE